jgi:hypothetical protein
MLATMFRRERNYAERDRDGPAALLFCGASVMFCDVYDDFCDVRNVLRCERDVGYSGRDVINDVRNVL